MTFFINRVLNGILVSPIQYALSGDALEKASDTDGEEGKLHKSNYILDFNYFTGTDVDVGKWMTYSRYVESIITTVNCAGMMSEKEWSVIVEAGKRLDPSAGDAEIVEYTGRLIGPAEYDHSTLVSVLKAIDKDSTIAVTHFLTEGYTHTPRALVSAAERMLNGLCITDEGQVNYPEWDRLLKDGFPCKVEEKDSFGPLTASVNLVKGKIIYG